jgi:hypothetical protein
VLNLSKSGGGGGSAGEQSGSEAGGHTGPEDDDDDDNVSDVDEEDDKEHGKHPHLGDLLKWSSWYYIKELEIEVVLVLFIPSWAGEGVRRVGGGRNFQGSSLPLIPTFFRYFAPTTTDKSIPHHTFLFPSPTPKNCIPAYHKKLIQ